MLSGSIAAFLAWALQYGKEKGIEQEAGKFPLGLKPSVLAAWGACCIARNAAARAYEKKGRSMLAGDHSCSAAHQAVTWCITASDVSRPHTALLCGFISSVKVRQEVPSGPRAQCADSLGPAASLARAAARAYEKKGHSMLTADTLIDQCASIPLQNAPQQRSWSLQAR